VNKIPAPRADDVCDRIRGAWSHLQIVHDAPQVHASHVTEPALRDVVEQNTRKAVAFMALERSLILVTPIEVEWVLTPRKTAGQKFDGAGSHPFDPGSDVLPNDWTETCDVHCRVYAFGLPQSALQAAR
jgi:hypothetical protein